MPHRADPLETVAEPACEAATISDLVDLFGSERFSRMLSSLDEEIVQRIETATPQDPTLGANAHILVSVSGTLGFRPLSSACAALERACLERRDPAGLLRDAQAAARAARRAIAALRIDG